VIRFWTAFYAFVVALAALTLSNRAAFAQETIAPLQVLKDRGTIRLCADAEFLPHSDSKMNPPGFDVEVAQAVAKHMGLEATMHWVVTMKGFRALRNLYDGECDFFMGLPRDESFLDEAFKLDVTTPYYNGGFATLIRKDAKSQNLADYKTTGVGVVMATVSDVRLFERGYQRKLYRSFEDVMAAFRKKELDVAVVPALEAGWAIYKNDHSELRILPHTDKGFLYPMGFGVRKKEKDVKAAIDAAIEALLSNGTIEKIRTKYGVPALIVAAEGDAAKVTKTATDAAVPTAETEKPISDMAAGAAHSADELAAEFPNDEKSIDKGRRLYKQACYKCHGENGVSGGTIPDLRRYQGDHYEMFAIIQSGRVEKGMPAWNDYLTTDEIKKIIVYVKSLPAE
jgi:polar amino acid transport system substrate-binding protein